MPQTEIIPCPHCQQPVEVELWQLLDLGREPDLRRRFLQGEINALRCDSCGANGLLPVPLVVHDPAKEQVIFFIPTDPRMTPDIEAQIQRDLGHTLMEALPAAPPNYAFRPAYIRDLDELAQLLQEGTKGNQNPTAAAQPTQELLQTLIQFIEASTWAESQQVLVAHPELLTDEAETLLDQIIESARQQGDTPNGFLQNTAPCWTVAASLV